MAPSNYSTKMTPPRRRRLCDRVLFAIVLVTVGVLFLAPPALAYDVSEIKLAFLYNFAKFTQWPDKSSPADDTFVIGILGENPFGNKPDALNDMKIGNQEVRVEHYLTLEELNDCDVLFINLPINESLQPIIDDLHAAHTLTVCDETDRKPSGCVIMYYIRKNRVRFEIDLDRMAGAELNISSKLLGLARIVGNQR